MRGRIVHLLGVDFIDTTESLRQPMPKDNGTEVIVRLPILVAQGALIEADFPRPPSEFQRRNSMLTLVDDAAHITGAAN